MGMKKNLSVAVFFLSMLSCLLINTAIVWAAQAIPAEAVKCANRGEYASKTSKTESDYADAAKEYEKASSIAPWVAGYYFNIGVLREKANQPQSAADAFKQYLLAEPNAKDASDVQKRIDGLEYAAEKAAKGPNPEDVASQEQKKYEDWLKKLNGAKFSQTFSNITYWFVIRGNYIMSYGSAWPSRVLETDVIHGREFHSTWGDTNCTGTINEDGSSLVLHDTKSGNEMVYSRE
jgi:tetratricopeptide (TPR) repeat protein